MSQEEKVSSFERVRFKHVIIDPEGPLDPHIKAVGDVNGDGLAEVIIPRYGGCGLRFGVDGVRKGG